MLDNEGFQIIDTMALQQLAEEAITEQLWNSRQIQRLDTGAEGLKDLKIVYIEKNFHRKVKRQVLHSILLRVYTRFFCACKKLNSTPGLLLIYQLL